jgi:hypothetical protein
MRHRLQEGEIRPATAGLIFDIPQKQSILYNEGILANVY